MTGGRRDGVGMVPVLHSEVEWEWVISSAVVTDHGSGLMDLRPQRPGDRGRAVPKARTCDGWGAGGESRSANRDFTEMASGEGDCRVKEAPDIGDEQLWVLEQ